jgi:hypothetical protein
MASLSTRVSADVPGGGRSGQSLPCSMEGRKLDAKRGGQLPR